MADTTTCKKCGSRSLTNQSLTISSRKGTLFVYLCDRCMQKFRDLWVIFIDPRVNQDPKEDIGEL